MNRRGDIVILDVPYSDRTGSKVRPALVVQANSWNQKIPQTIIALITSSQRRLVGASTQVVIDISTADGQRTGLRSDSIVQCNHLLTISQALIHRKIGFISTPLMLRIDEALKETLGL